ncbi:rhodanese-like domain-containing protein [Niabella sp. CC-SYL272]|uniref:rhodanese-like domain-containing protein n=1 Tax=Niabella agricola TaxID=2891571 RepID=UPI001F1E3137|nr:rhodanese-like domain-containing protein [Niabella agricola]MCF3107595.1 rhodanese-like domain-containing protein [Niabella agricola]
MKHVFFLHIVLFLLKGTAAAQPTKEPWSEAQLMATQTLAAQISKKTDDHLLIVSVGPDAVIKGSVNMGPAHEPEHLKQLKRYLKKIPRTKEIVLYCGCCPFDRCPNIRPAFKTITGMGFKKAWLLNIPKNIKTDWLDKQYPVNEE